MSVEIGYVVLYVNDTNAIANFWQQAFDFEIKNEVEAGTEKVITVGAKGGQTNFELVPLSLMADNPYNLNLGIPSICLYADDLQAEHNRLKEIGIEVSEIADHGGRNAFTVFDSEKNAFAVVGK